MRFQQTSPVLISALLFFAGAGCAESTLDPDGSVLPPRTDAAVAELSELLKKAAAEGQVKVIVGLRLDTGPYTPEGELSPAGVAEQRQAIVAAREALVASLAGYDFEVTTTYDSLPYVAMKVDRATLMRLMDSPYVTTIEEDREIGL
jgi:hypothetical protein